MKNIFIKAISLTGIAFLLNTAATAQVTSEMQDFYDSTVVTNDTAYFWVGFGQLHVYNFNQLNISAVDNTYKFYKTNVQMAGGSTSNFCVFHNNDQGDPQSQCYIPSVTQSGNFITEVGEFNTLQADFHADSFVAGVSVVLYRIVNVNNPADSIFLTLIYNTTPVGISEAANTMLGEPYPNPATDNVSVSYNFSNENGGNAVVTDLGGKVVYTQNLASESGTLAIETSSWAKGVYVISITDENGIAARRKIVVQ